MTSSTSRINIPLVDLKSQYEALRDKIDLAISEVINRSAFIGGDFVNEFEHAFASYCGVPHCVGTGNGTDALFIALKTLGIGSGDEVITVANSFIATAEAIGMTGARVDFVDMDPTTHNIDVGTIEARITSRTKAIVPVHLYGRPADMSPIVRIAKDHGLYVVGDAAQAHGAYYDDKPVAQWTDISCFSFYPGKNLGAYGDAGALVTANADWAAKARMFANHGRSKKYDHEFEGINSRLDGIQAAILSVKLRYLDEWTIRRRRHASHYNELLRSIGVAVPDGNIDQSVHHLYVVRVPRENRDKIRKHLLVNGISSGVHYPTPLPLLKAYSHLGYSRKDCPQAVVASEEVLSLPMFPELTEAQVEYVAQTMRQIAKSVRKIDPLGADALRV